MKFPTLLIVGTYDCLLNPDVIRDSSKRFDHVEYVEYQGHHGMFLCSLSHFRSITKSIKKFQKKYQSNNNTPYIRINNLMENRTEFSVDDSGDDLTLPTF
eukprot:UN27378